MNSYSKFLDDLNDVYKDREAKGVFVKLSNDDALAVVRDKWIRDGRLKELISFIHTNWDSGNCDDFIEPLTKFLIDTRQIEHFKTLWIKIIKYRLTALWHSLDELRKQAKPVVLKEIEAIDTSNFNMFSRDSYKDQTKVLAFQRLFALDGMAKFRDGLIRLNQTDDSNAVSKFIDDVARLKRSTFKL